MQSQKWLFKALQLTKPEETGHCFNIILMLSEFLEPTKGGLVQVSSELALYAVFLYVEWFVVPFPTALDQNPFQCEFLNRNNLKSGLQNKHNLYLLLNF